MHNMIVHQLFKSACVAGFVLARPSLELERRSDNPLAGHGSLRVFDVNNFNSLSTGQAPDMYDIFAAEKDGCFGAIRDHSQCTPKKRNHNIIAQNRMKTSENIMKVPILAGTYAGDQEGSGSQFYTNQLDSLWGLLAATLEYEVYFDDDFDFAKGGKLPGVHGGDRSCSGGYKARGNDCFSTRLMWRENGEGEAYLYLPMALQSDNFCEKCSGYSKGTTCDEMTYCSLNRASFSFIKGQWNKIKMQVWMNTDGNQDGYWNLFHNEKLVMNENSLTYRIDDSVPLSGMFFSTFFGGGSSDYAPDYDTHIDFKGFRLTAGII
ncbi:hypothetical protein SARC_07789 [Sphaeroforma arctica JP610]|uniref:Polysaccharide lyase 14 domain-containing protein n=1 Tax=Sphaeroforma arctica JP610 TaxID=667725 RepID=A0A0L0FT16_9EUKA|nr:hypothetical protein SARC_07789 [Sphaeroforma arctica JP610]KNC79829.1 hypothetical protein SARC_07789 [Sphaeroforma arctica JP610]|eukprot:XP_014153731.1 hypothetical protein SARC_07789 [Sphaeroforma arctica JP610]